MKVLGITGGVGSGKSEILRYLEESFGAYVCQMDEAARRLQRSGESCFRQIVDVFGREIIGADGELDRARLAAIVFSDEEKMEKLNRIVHPEVIRYVKKDILEKEKDGTGLYVLEAALLPDVGKDLCDELWYVYTEEKVRRDRLRSSRGYTDEKITQMMAAQPDEERFRRICTAVIDNSGTFENTEKQIGELLKQ